MDTMYSQEVNITYAPTHAFLFETNKILAVKWHDDHKREASSMVNQGVHHKWQFITESQVRKLQLQLLKSLVLPKPELNLGLPTVLSER